MKKIVTLLLSSLIINVSLTQNNILPLKNGEPKKSNLEFETKSLSPFTALLIMDIKLYEINKENNSDSLLIYKYGLIKMNNTIYANSFVIPADNYEPKELLKYGFLSGSHSGQILTGLIPIDEILEISNSNLVKYIQIGEPTEQLLDNARARTWVDWVHQGYQLPQSYFGNGVIVGVIDAGFDYTHPNFYDGTGSNNYRIKRVWEQTKTGTPPSSFSYGRELTSQAAILNAQTDFSANSHGTHVTGIAAGAGGGANTTFMGVAPQSDIVLVSTNFGTSGILDGITYILNYATSIGKPCVINMSLGSHRGPHDGTSLFDQSCDAIVGSGKLLVGSAGNDGDKKVYLDKSYTLIDTLMYSFVKFPNSSLLTNGEATIDIWGQPFQNFWVAVSIYNTNTNQFEAWTPYISANTSNTYNYTLQDADVFSSDNCFVSMATEINPFNNKPHMLLTINNIAQDDNYRWAMIEIIAYNTQTKMWAVENINYKTLFDNNGYGSPVLSGTTSSTITELGGTGNSIISVGAYTSKNSWTALNSSNQTAYYNTLDGAIAPFSSKGPTADGRTKPDITAPGNVIVSSLNRFDSNYPSNSNNVVTGVTNGTNNWYFGAMEGTSMAAPMVTGIMALWLQANPNLTPSQAKTLLKNNAWTDSYTGTISSSGSNTWGWGKIDAHEGLKDLLNITVVKNFETSNTNIMIFPNPTKGQINISFSEASSNVTVEIYDLLGKIVHNQLINKITKDEVELINLSGLTDGIYNLRITIDKNISNHKLLLNR